MPNVGFAIARAGSRLSLPRRYTIHPILKYLPSKEVDHILRQPSWRWGDSMRKQRTRGPPSGWFSIRITWQSGRPPAPFNRSSHSLPGFSRLSEQGGIPASSQQRPSPTRVARRSLHPVPQDLLGNGVLAPAAWSASRWLLNDTFGTDV